MIKKLPLELVSARNDYPMLMDQYNLAHRRADATGAAPCGALGRDVPLATVVAYAVAICDRAQCYPIHGGRPPRSAR